jgi:hypothetical protein
MFYDFFMTVFFAFKHYQLILMKTSFFYFSLFLSCFAISCQEQYSDAIIVEYLELDKSLKHSAALIDQVNIALISKLAEDAQTRTQLQPLIDKAKEIRHASIDLNNFIAQLRETLIVKTGGYYEKEEATAMDKTFLEHCPKGTRNIAIVEQVLFSNNASKLDSSLTISKVEMLEQKMQALHSQYLQMIVAYWDNGGLKGTIFADIRKKDAAVKRLKKELSLYFSTNYKAEEYNNQTWVDFNFKNKPLAAVLPILRKIQNDIQISESALISFLSSQFSTLSNSPIKILDVFIQSSTPSIHLGKIYEANLVLGAFSPQTDFKILINGDTLKSLDGRVIYRVRPTKTGKQHYNAEIHFTNPLTGENNVFRKDFYFEVIP